MEHESRLVRSLLKNQPFPIRRVAAAVLLAMFLIAFLPPLALLFLIPLEPIRPFDFLVTALRRLPLQQGDLSAITGRSLYDLGPEVRRSELCCVLEEDRFVFLGLNAVRFAKMAALAENN